MDCLNRLLRPQYPYWRLVLLARKLCLVSVTVRCTRARCCTLDPQRVRGLRRVLARNNSMFQASLCAALAVAYALHAKHQPFVSPAVQAAAAAAAAASAPVSAVDTPAAVVRKELLDLNVMETTLLCACVAIILQGMIFQSSEFTPSGPAYVILTVSTACVIIGALVLFLFNLLKEMQRTCRPMDVSRIDKQSRTTPRVNAAGLGRATVSLRSARDRIVFGGGAQPLRAPSSLDVAADGRQVDVVVDSPLAAQRALQPYAEGAMMNVAACDDVSSPEIVARTADRGAEDSPVRAAPNMGRVTALVRAVLRPARPAAAAAGGNGGGASPSSLASVETTSGSPRARGRDRSHLLEKYRYKSIRGPHVTKVSERLERAVGTTASGVWVVAEPADGMARSKDLLVAATSFENPMRQPRIATNPVGASCHEATARGDIVSPSIDVSLASIEQPKRYAPVTTSREGEAPHEASTSCGEIISRAADGSGGGGHQHLMTPGQRRERGREVIKLPGDWRELVDAAGTVFYFSKEASATTWDRPGLDATLDDWREFNDPTTGAPYWYSEARNDTSLTRPVVQRRPPADPRAWEQRFASDGVPYYFNAVSLESTWTRPAAWGPPGASGPDN